eukprot:GHVT01070206.1.p1 GENE.GHVT01070206.1~~GHVT01070206.1.p1  ORF type:complete len:101 (+),score=19.47 GHVT01070206.1:1036-1338(+)
MASALSRAALLRWLNQILDTNYQTFTQCKDGLAYGQLLDVLFPGRIPLEQFDWAAETPAELKRNVRVLTSATRDLPIPTDVVLPRLCEWTGMEHLSFLRW